MSDIMAGDDFSLIHGDFSFYRENSSEEEIDLERYLSFLSALA